MQEQFRSSRRQHDKTSFYKYVTSGVAKIVLVNRKLRWSSPLLFNDPFDVPRRFDPGYDEDRLYEVVTDRATHFLEQGDPADLAPRSLIKIFFQIPGFTTNRELRRQLAKQLRKDYQNGELPRGTRGSFDDLRLLWENTLKEARILCFTTRRDSASMWAHYSDSGRGVVLEFACLDETDSPWLMAREVAYQDEPPRLASVEEWADNILGLNDIDLPMRLLDLQYFKKTDWSYEREWRVAGRARPGETGLHSDWLFHRRDLSSVTLGTSCSTKDRSDILALLSGDFEHVRAYEAVEDEHNYRFRRIITR